MVCLPGLDSKSYEQFLGDGVIPPVRCPDPRCNGAVLRGHGWYPRYLGGVQQRFRRCRCPQCGVSHALLPEDVCAYRDALLVEVEAGLKAESASLGARAAGSLAPMGCDGCGAGAAARTPPGCRPCWRCCRRPRGLGGKESRKSSGRRPAGCCGCAVGCGSPTAFCSVD